MSVPEQATPGARRTSDPGPAGLRRAGLDGIDEVAARLRSRIVRAELAPGESLGDEASLAAELAVSTDAVRAAVDRLEQSGHVRRDLGPAGGVLVIDGRLELPLDSVEGLPDPGADERVRVLRASVGPAGPQESRRLALADGAGVVRVLRVRTVSGRPFSIELVHLPDELFPGLVDHDLTFLHATLRTAYGVTSRATSVTVEVTSADPVQAEQLWVAVGAPLVRVRRLSVDREGRPVADTHEHVAADRVRYHVRTPTSAPLTPRA